MIFLRKNIFSFSEKRLTSNFHKVFIYLFIYLFIHLFIYSFIYGSEGLVEEF